MAVQPPPPPDQPQTAFPPPPPAPPPGAAPPAPVFGPPTRPTNTLAIVSLAAGIAGWLVFHGIGPLVAIVTGHMARGQIRRTGEAGKEMALIGLILGYVYFAVVILLIAFFLVVFGAFGIYAATHPHR